MLLNELKNCETLTEANRIALDICDKISYKNNYSKRSCKCHTNAIINCSRRFYDSKYGGISTLLYAISEIGYGDFSNVIPFVIDILTSADKCYMEKLEAFDCIYYMEFDDVDKDIFNISLNRLNEYAKILINSDNPDDNTIDDVFPSVSEMIATSLEIFNSNLEENFDESSN